METQTNMNPVVVIATHNRILITSRTIDALNKQSVKPKIVLVVSEKKEYDYFTNRHKDIYVVFCANNPLGNKWQTGVYYASINLDADPLIILGSDDLLGEGYVKNICNLMKSHKADFVGINRWWLTDEKTKEVYLMEYENKSFPLGGGRAYSKNILSKLNYVVFDITKNKLLDDYGWKESINTGLKCAMVQKCNEFGLNIISIKGEWEMLNTADAILKSTTCNVIEQISMDKLNNIL